MSKPYNNTKATLALAKASFRSIMRSPSAVVFTLAFPLIFILVFGFLGGGGIKVDLAVAPGSDLQNPVIHALEKNNVIHLIRGKDAAEMILDFSELQLTGKRTVRDLWRQKDLGRYKQKFTAQVPPQGVVMVKIGK